MSKAVSDERTLKAVVEYLEEIGELQDDVAVTGIFLATLRSELTRLRAENIDLAETLAEKEKLLSRILGERDDWRRLACRSEPHEVRDPVTHLPQCCEDARKREDDTLCFFTCLACRRMWGKEDGETWTEQAFFKTRRSATTKEE